MLLSIFSRPVRACIDIEVPDGDGERGHSHGESVAAPKAPVRRRGTRVIAGPFTPAGRACRRQEVPIATRGKIRGEVGAAPKVPVGAEQDETYCVGIATAGRVAIAIKSPIATETGTDPRRRGGGAEGPVPSAEEDRAVLLRNRRGQAGLPRR